MSHDDIDCAAGAVAMGRTILEEADRIGCTRRTPDPETEIRARLPALYGQLSPDARALLMHWCDHIAELVAFASLYDSVHQVTSRAARRPPRTGRPRRSTGPGS